MYKTVSSIDIIFCINTSYETFVSKKPTNKQKPVFLTEFVIFCKWKRKDIITDVTLLNNITRGNSNEQKKYQNRFSPENC